MGPFRVLSVPICTLFVRRWRTSCVRPAHENRVWFYDFMSAKTHEGRTVRSLDPIDEHSQGMPDDPAGMAAEFGEGRFSLPFSSRSCPSSRNSLRPSPAYFFFHR
jgi:hypothetical protein